MGLMRAAVQGIAQIRADVSGTPAPWDDFWYTSVGAGTSAGVRVTPDTAKRISTVLACVNKIAKTVAMLTRHVYSEQTDGGKKLATSHPIYDIIHSRPNARQTGFEFFQMMQGHLELRGNAYAEIIPGPRGAIDQLIPMHPDRVFPELLASGRVRYRYNDPLNNQDRYLVQEQVFHLRNFMDDGVMGQSTVSLGADVFGIAIAAQDYYGRFLRNDAKPGLVLTGANFKNKQDRDAFRESWQESQTGANRHKAAVLPSGMDVKTVGVSGRDAELLEARKFSRIEICSMFDVPPHLIGETEKTATYASVEQFNIMFATYCILPRVILWEQAIQRDLIFSPRFFAKFSMGALLRGDTTSRFNAYKVAIENGWMNQDEVRIEEDRNPIPGGEGKNYWRPLNWARLGDVHTSVAPKTDKGAAEDAASDQPAPAESTGNARLDPRFYLMIADGADRCVRKELAAVTKLLDKNASDDEIAAFYADHAKFVSQVLHISASAARRYYCGERLAQVKALPRETAVMQLATGEDEQVRTLTAMAVEVIQ